MSPSNQVFSGVEVITAAGLSFQQEIEDGDQVGDGNSLSEITFREHRREAISEANGY